MPSSTARVATDAAPRYAKQLASHLGRKVAVDANPADQPAGSYRLTLGAGEGVLVPEADHLLLQATAADDAGLAVVQDVLGRHLERFGQRNELVVTWESAS
jgi:hypothetical protein